MQVPSIVSHLKYGRQAGQPQLKAFLPRVGTTRKKNPKLITMLFLMMGGIFCRTEFRSLLTICSAESGKTQELMLYCLYNKIKPQNPWMILLYVSVAYQHAYNFYIRSRGWVLIVFQILYRKRHRELLDYFFLFCNGD